MGCSSSTVSVKGENSMSKTSHMIKVATSLDLTQHSAHDDERNEAYGMKNDKSPMLIDNAQFGWIQSACIMSRKGTNVFSPDKMNQDSYFHITDSANDTFVMCVLDGHGDNGELASNFMAVELPIAIQKNQYYKSDMSRALTEAILHTETLLIQRHRSNLAFSGTTLSLVAIRGSKVISAKVGDSRSIIGGNTATCALSRDHKASLADERERIIAAGGRVITRTYEDGYVGPARVYLGNADLPGLAMSRSLGDIMVHSAGVSSVPELTERELTTEDKFIVLATDGLWDFFPNDETMDIVCTNATPSEGVTALMTDSVPRWEKECPAVMDDTTIGVIALGKRRSAMFQ